MRCWALYILSLFVVILASVQAVANSTDNLLSQDFTDGSWTGTNISTTHGSDTIAGVHNQYVESTITTDLYGLYLSELSANVWFWNNESQSVEINQTIKDSNGKEYSNTTTVNGSCATWNGCSYGQTPVNQIYITDNADTFDITARFSFTVPNQPNSHYGADLKEPSLILWYEPFQVDIKTTNDVDLWVENFEMMYKDDFKEDTFTFGIDPFKEENKLPNDYYLFDQDMYLFMEESKEVIEEEMLEEEIIEEELIEEKNSLEEPEKETQPVSSFVSINKNGTIPLANLLLPDDSFSIEVMVQSQPLMLDTVAYEPTILYPNQLNLFDNRDIYNDVTYKANDPLTTFNTSIEENQEQRYKLRQKLESMLWKN